MTFSRILAAATVAAAIASVSAPASAYEQRGYDGYSGKHSKTTTTATRTNGATNRGTAPDHRSVEEPRRGGNSYAVVIKDRYDNHYRRGHHRWHKWKRWHRWGYNGRPSRYW